MIDPGWLDLHSFSSFWFSVVDQDWRHRLERIRTKITCHVASLILEHSSSCPQEVWVGQSSGLGTTFVTFGWFCEVRLIKIDKMRKDYISECYFRHQVRFQNIKKAKLVVWNLTQFQQCFQRNTNTHKEYCMASLSHEKCQSPFVAYLRHIHSGSDNLLIYQTRDLNLHTLSNSCADPPLSHGFWLVYVVWIMGPQLL